MIVPIKNKGQLTNFLKRLPTRTRNLIILLVISIVFSLLFNTFYKPQRMVINRLKTELNALKDEVAQTKAQIPDITKEKRLLEQENESLNVLKRELGSLEAELPQQDSLPGLLQELLRQSSGYAVDFTSIKPVEAKEKEEYARLNMEMRFNANFIGLVNYLNRLENISQFINTEDIVIERKETSDVSVTMIIVTFLGEKISGQPLLSTTRSLNVQPIATKNNPFISDWITDEISQQKPAYKLSGIISQGKQPTAIINDEVYKIGDSLDNAQVQEISAQRVVLKKGQELIELLIEKE